MKAKIFAFIGFAIAAIGTSVILNATPAHATGEEYRWISANSIEASHGMYAVAGASGNDATLVFTRNSSGEFVVVSPGACTVTFTLTPRVDNTRGTLDLELADDCNVDGYDFDTSFAIADPQNGPPLPGSDIDFESLNCENYVNLPEMGENFDQERWRCEAMQSCIEQGNTERACLQAWVTCVADTNNSFVCRDDMIENGVNIGEDDEEVAGNATTCAIDGLGWIVCPIVNFLAQVADGAYGIVAGLLEVQPLTTTGTSEPIYQAWSIMRNFANVAFVIIFLVIIFSQVTGFGISNYGIKRMLPRLIIAAILVNVSYWICAIAVDLSNILGYSLKEVFENVGATFQAPEFSGSQTGEGGWGALAAPILAGGILAGVAGALYIGLSAFLPLLITAIFALLSAFLVLAIRQALIILLIVVSPLAFVTFLLPNTQGLFSKWRTLFQSLLIVFPIISLIFGASALASQVITASAANIQDEAQQFAVQAAGAAMSTIPLIAVLLIGKFMGKINGFINNPARGLVDRAKKGAEGVHERQQQRRTIRALGGGNVFGKSGFKRRARRDAIRSGVASEAQRAQGAYVADQALNDERFRNRLAGGLATGPNASPEALNRAVAGAVSAQAKIEAEEVTAASAVIKNANLDRSREAMRALSSGGDYGGLKGSDFAVRAAAMKQVVDSQDIKGINSLLDSVGSMDQKTREAFADSLASSKGRPGYVGQSAISNIRRHGETEVDETGKATLIQAKGSLDLAKSAIQANTYSAEKIASGDQEEIEYMAKVASRSDVDNSKIRANADQARTNDRLKGQISKNEAGVDALANGTSI